MDDRGVVIGLEGLHQVDPGQIFVADIDAEQVLAGDIGETTAGRRRADEHRLVSHPEQFIHGQDPPDHHVGDDFDAKVLQVADLPLHDLFRESGRREFRRPGRRPRVWKASTP